MSSLTRFTNTIHVSFDIEWKFSDWIWSLKSTFGGKQEPFNVLSPAFLKRFTWFILTKGN